jgi:hypothetical protein
VLLQSATRQGPRVSQRLVAIKRLESEVQLATRNGELDEDSGESGELNHALMMLCIHAHGSSDVGNAFITLREHVQALGENIDYVAAVAREVEED